MKKKDKNLLWGALLVGGAYWLWMKREEEADVGFYGNYGGKYFRKGKPSLFGSGPQPVRRKSLMRRLKRISQRLAQMPHDAPGRKRLIKRQRAIQTKLAKMGVRFGKRRSDSIAAEDAAEMAGYIHQVRATAPLDHWRYG